MTRVSLAQTLAPRRSLLFDAVEQCKIWLEVPGHRPFRATYGDVDAGRYAKLRAARNPRELREPDDPELIWLPPFWGDEPGFDCFSRAVGSAKAEAGFKSGKYRPTTKVHTTGKRKGQPRHPPKGMVWVVESMGHTSLFTNTSKMAAGSFSLPAGGPTMGGTCPSANTTAEVAGLDPGAYKAQSRAIPRLAIASTAASGTFPRRLPMLKNQEPLDRLTEDRNICSRCYAAKANFGNANIQSYQMVRYAWTYATVQRGTFVDEMTSALERFFGNVRTRASARTAKGASPQALDYFRLHDSGDFFSTEYLLAWARVCANLPTVHFWAPTRTWMLPPFAKAIRAAHEIAPNLVIRPSALQFDDPSPIVDGLPAAGSTAHKADKADALAPLKAGVATWDCPAYALDMKSCRGALNMDQIKTAEQRLYIEEARANFKSLFGREAPDDCRVCWREPQVTISYHAH